MSVIEWALVLQSYLKQRQPTPPLFYRFMFPSLHPSAKSIPSSFHMPQKSIPASFFPHAPCPPSWIPSLPAILTPVLHACHLFKTAYATLGTCLSTDPTLRGNSLSRGNRFKGGRTLGAPREGRVDPRRLSSESGRFSSWLECKACIWLPADGLVSFSDGVCVIWEMVPVFERRVFIEIW